MFCMQNNQLLTKSHVDLEENSTKQEFSSLWLEVTSNYLLSVEMYFAYNNCHLALALETFLLL